MNSPVTELRRYRTGALRAPAPASERSAPRKIRLAWDLLVPNVLSCYGSLVHVPGAAGKGLTRRVLPLTVNRMAISRPNALLCPVSLLAVETIVTNMQLQHVGTVYPSFRLVKRVAAPWRLSPWRLSPWWGHRNLLLVRSQLMSLLVVAGPLVLGSSVGPGRVLNGGGLSGGAVGDPGHACGALRDGYGQTGLRVLARRPDTRRSRPPLRTGADMRVIYSISAIARPPRYGDLRMARLCK